MVLDKLARADPGMLHSLALIQRIQVGAGCAGLRAGLGVQGWG